LTVCRYFGAAKDLPGVRELFEQARTSMILEILQHAFEKDVSYWFYSLVLGNYEEEVEAALKQ